MTLLSSVRTTLYTRFYCTLILCCCSAWMIPTDSLAYDCEGATFKDSEFTKPATDFSPYEKVFLRIICKGLPAGTYAITSDWKNSQNEIYRQNRHEFTLNQQSDYMTFSWIKLIRKGPLKRTFTGQDFSAMSYGEWTVRAYLKGEQISNNSFSFK